METSSSAGLFNQEDNNEKTEVGREETRVPEAGKKNSDPRKCVDVDVINLRNIRQVYKTGKGKSDFVLFDNLNLDIKDFEHTGQFISILGESGCGKSTILRYISGLQQPTEGEILIYGKKKTDNITVPMVFQQYSSLPWKTVLDNIALPLQMHGIPKEERYERAYKIIKEVGLEGHEHKWAKYPLLSGGQLQRVAIARSLIASPQILLMDEPFGALDISTRTGMQQLILDIYNSAHLDPTIIFITHDISEAVLLSNRIYIMKARPGRIDTIIDVDLPEERNISMKKSAELNQYVNYIDNIMSKK